MRENEETLCGWVYPRDPSTFSFTWLVQLCLAACHFRSVLAVWDVSALVTLRRNQKSAYPVAIRLGYLFYSISFPWPIGSNTSSYIVRVLDVEPGILIVRAVGRWLCVSHQGTQLR